MNLAKNLRKYFRRRFRVKEKRGKIFMIKLESRKNVRLLGIFLLIVAFTFLTGIATAVSPAELSIMIKGGRGGGWIDILQEDLNEFENKMAEKGTPVKIELNNYEGKNEPYITKLALMLNSGTAPDVLYVESGIGADFMRANYFYPLDNFIEKWQPWEETFDMFKKAMSWAGHAYMIPIQSCSIVIYYRKDLFEKAGLDTKWQPTSWDEIISAAEKIKAELPGVIPLLYTGGPEAGEQVTFSRFLPLLHAAGGALYDEGKNKWLVTSEPLLETFKFYEEITKKELINPQIAIDADADQIAAKIFSEGKGAINQFGSWAYEIFWGPGAPYEIPNRDDVVGYAKIPAKSPGASFRGQDFVNQSGGWNYAIAHNSKNPELAWELIEFLSETERQAGYNAIKGNVATRKDVIMTDLYQQGEFLAEVSAWLEYTYMTPYINPGYTGAPRDNLQRAIGRIIIGDWNAEQAMESFAKALENDLGSEKVLYTK